MLKQFIVNTKSAVKVSADQIDSITIFSPSITTKAPPETFLTISLPLYSSRVMNLLPVALVNFLGTTACQRGKSPRTTCGASRNTPKYGNPDLD